MNICIGWQKFANFNYQVDFSKYMAMGYDSPMKILNRRTDYMYSKSDPESNIWILLIEKSTSIENLKQVLASTVMNTTYNFLFEKGELCLETRNQNVKLNWTMQKSQN